MKIKVFAFQRPYFSMWKIDANEMELEIQNWLSRNNRIKVTEIKHELIQGIWYAPQLIVSIYYTDSTEQYNE